MIYANYEFYKDVFNGKNISDESEFNSIALKASSYIDKIVSKPLTESDTELYSEKIQLAVCGICDVLSDFTNNNIVSENNDGYSVTYSNDPKIKDTLLYNTARMYLPSVLLYRGL